jgi:hypothetical protein
MIELPNMYLYIYIHTHTQTHTHTHEYIIELPNMYLIYPYPSARPVAGTANVTADIAKMPLHN